MLITNLYHSYRTFSPKIRTKQLIRSFYLYLSVILATFIGMIGEGSKDEWAKEATTISISSNEISPIEWNEFNAHERVPIHITS